MWPFKKKIPRPYVKYLTVEEMEAVQVDGKLTKESHELLVGKFNSLVLAHNRLLEILDIGDKNTPRP